MDKVQLVKKVQAAIASQDQLVFTYQHKDSKDDELVVRYVTPSELDGDTVLCVQHLPKSGIRRFNLDKIERLSRVITRDVPEVKDEGEED